MKAGEIITAYAAILPLMDADLNWQDSYEVLRLKKKLQAEAEIFSQQEKKLVDRLADRDEHGKIIIDENGRFKITGENIKTFTDERQKMIDVSVLWDSKKIRIHTDKVKPAIIEALDKFIEFI